jgi:hypothetical protein
MRLDTDPVSKTFSNSLEFWIMDTIQKPSDPELAEPCYSFTMKLQFMVCFEHQLGEILEREGNSILKLLTWSH